VVPSIASIGNAYDSLSPRRSLRHFRSKESENPPAGFCGGRTAQGEMRPRPSSTHHKRGTAEQWIKEGKQAVKMTRLSCHRFRANEVRLWLSVIAYNLGNLWRRLGLPKRIDTWSLTSLQQRLMKTGGRLVKHARYYWLLLAEGHLTRRLFGAIVQRLTTLSVPAG